MSNALIPYALQGRQSYTKRQALSATPARFERSLRWSYPCLMNFRVTLSDVHSCPAEKLIYARLSVKGPHVVQVVNGLP